MARGRPPGSKNRPKTMLPTTLEPVTGDNEPKRRGRPPGSKNRAKDGSEPTEPITFWKPTSSNVGMFGTTYSNCQNDNCKEVNKLNGDRLAHENKTENGKFKPYCPGCERWLAEHGQIAA